MSFVRRDDGCPAINRDTFRAPRNGCCGVNDIITTTTGPDNPDARFLERKEMG